MAPRQLSLLMAYRFLPHWWTSHQNEPNTVAKRDPSAPYAASSKKVPPRFKTLLLSNTSNRLKSPEYAHLREQYTASSQHAKCVRFENPFQCCCGFPHTTPFRVLDNITVQPLSSPAGPLQGQLIVKTQHVEAFSLRR